MPSLLITSLNSDQNTGIQFRSATLSRKGTGSVCLKNDVPTKSLVYHSIPPSTMPILRGHGHPFSGHIRVNDPMRNCPTISEDSRMALPGARATSKSPKSFNSWS